MSPPRRKRCVGFRTACSICGRASRPFVAARMQESAWPTMAAIMPAERRWAGPTTRSMSTACSRP